MVYVLLGTNLILLIILCCQWAVRRKQKRQLWYLGRKLREIRMEESRERILIPDAKEELREVCTELNCFLEAKEEAERDFRSRESAIRMMLSNVSHDLKTPLTVVLGYVEMLRERRPQEEMIGKVDAKVQEVLALVNQFFDLAKLKSGDRELRAEPVNVSAACRNTVLQFYQMMTNMQFQVELVIPEIPVYIMGDEDALTRVLENLLSNAVKYGAEGRYFGLSMWTADGDVCIRVTDHGRGIPARHKDAVFERMYTLEDSRSRNFQGSGLGLAISKTLTERMKGKIVLESIPWKHTDFTVSFPQVFPT
ncbi:sensor histidine kinase [Ruminococcus gauvreauii]|uniref:sensor histidine kinase n=1 Tax=Ruminococcus gauvreauii TaxID=438033 RepID=UPI003984454A